MIASLILFAFFAYAIDGKICNSLKKVGCYEKLGGTDHMKQLIYNGRGDIDWKDYTKSLEKILCKCKEIAQKDGYDLIGLQYYGECWGSKLSMQNFIAQAKGSASCINGIYKPCGNKDHELCSGGAQSTAVFVEHISNSHHSKPVDGGYGEWTSWSTCSATCNDGVQERYRICDNPKPKNGGKECEGEPEETRSCFEKQCRQTEMTSYFCDVQIGTNHTEISTITGYSPATPFCAILDRRPAADSSKYTVSVDIYGVLDKPTRMGIMFNAKDEDNYEFVHIHLKSNSHCYSTGKVQYGNLNEQEIKTDQCHRVFNTKQWHHLEVTVHNDKVTLKVDREKIAKWYSALHNAGQGGVVLKNGWSGSDKEQALYKNLKVE